MKNIISTLLFILAFTAGFAQMNNNGGIITVQPNATLVIQGDYTVSGGGQLTIDGTVQLKGDYVNNTGTINASAGTLKFDGTTNQKIRGTEVTGTTFNCDVEVNNTAGVTLMEDQSILGDLTLTNGVVTLGSNHLTLDAGSTVSRTNGFVNATGTGEFRKRFDFAGSFTMPIGDAANYTPVTVAFNSGSFGPSAYVGSRVTASAHPNKPTAADYLTRYWSLSSNDISNIDCDLTFNFVSGDVQGTTIGNIFTTKYLGSGSWQSFNQYTSGNQLTASSVTGFSDWSGSSKIATTVDLTAFLQGPYNTATDEMDPDINGYLPLDQPFDGNVNAMWYYTGTESVGAIPNTDIVDWVLVEFRHAATPENATSSTIVGRAPGFLMKNGSVVALNGSSNLKVDGVSPFSDNLYAVLYQRNHLGIMSKYGVADGNSDGIFDYDFTTSDDKVFGGSLGYKLLETGVWGMVGGDGTGDGNIYTDDYTTAWLSQFGNETGYYSADYTLNSSVQTDDYTTVWVSNFGIQGPMPLMVLPDLSNIALKYRSQIPEK